MNTARILYPKIGSLIFRSFLPESYKTYIVVESNIDSARLLRQDHPNNKGKDDFNKWQRHYEKVTGKK